MMNNFFSVEVDGNNRPVFEKYMVKRISNKTNKEIENMNIIINDFQNKYKNIFSKLSSLTMLLSFPFIIVVLSFFFLFDLKIALIGAVGFVLCIALSFLFMFLEYQKTKKINNSEEYILLNKDAKKLIDKAYEELDIVDVKNSIDCYFNYYETKKGRKISSLPYKSLMVKEYIVFKDETYLFFGDVYGLIKIPLSSIKGFEESNDSISFYGWNKNELPSSKTYKNYKIRNINNMYFKIKPYYALNVELENVDYYIYVASYDKEIIKKVLDINN